MSDTKKREKNQILRLWRRSDEYMRLLQAAQDGGGPGSVGGVADAPAGHLIASLLDSVDGSPALIITHSESEARRVAEEMSELLEGIVLFPAREIQLAAYYAAGRELSAKRVAALTSFLSGDCRGLVCSAESLLQRLVPPEAFAQSEIRLELGDTIQPDILAAKLSAGGYERVDRVEGAGQFRLGGGIVDVFLPGEEKALRIEFFDDEIDSLRTFDVEDQRSADQVKSLCIPPAMEVPILEEARALGRKELLKEAKESGDGQAERIELLISHLDQGLSVEGAEQLLPYFYPEATLLDYLQSDALCFVMESKRVEETLEDQQQAFLERFAQSLEDGQALRKQGELLEKPIEIWKKLDRSHSFLFSGLNRVSREIQPRSLFQFQLRGAPQYGARLDMLADDLKQLQKNSSALLLAGKHAERVCEALRNADIAFGHARSLNRQLAMGEVLVLEESVSRGFESSELRLLLLGEEDLFGKRKRAVQKKQRKKRENLELFSELKIGDFVVHDKYGIGQFKGIETHNVQGHARDFLIIQYAGSDRVGVATDELDRVQKFIGASEKGPKISKLGGADWKKNVAKTRASVKELAFDLVKLYAEREQNKGFVFSPDTVWQNDLENSFPYEETEGQLRALEEIKGDMESPRVMDRLLCGDVGYGKTEVALRAAFKAVQDSKQVALLVPTTILAQQHYITLKRRFEGFPVEVEMISRLRTAAQQKDILKRVKDGRVDVLVGTHRLLGKDIKFHDLGLLIIDEEQRFGVAHKEQIKERKKDLDVLSLSATPIPRTLHMSLAGIRDMSILDTPPEDRYPVQTYVMEYSDEIIREAICKEIAHGGQVYFLYNNVAGMDRMLAYLRELVPEAEFAAAHGQMPQGALEKTMLAFMEQEFDVLLCSTIIEAGLDIANANTLIVYDADHYGVSQLYQLRGRVGRSNRMAYAYLTVRPDKQLSEVAEKRLRALREFTEFGSGFKIAMRDLEIRGAGELLGAQQHGHLDDVGYDYYVRLLEEAMNEVKGEAPRQKIDTKMDVAINASISHTYIHNEAARLEIYKRIAAIDSEDEYADVVDEMIDRFGEVPQETLHLLDISLLKHYAEAAGIDRVTIREGGARLHFAPQSAVSGGELMKILQEEPALRLLPGDGSELEWKQKTRDSAAVVHAITPILAKMCACATGQAQV